MVPWGTMHSGGSLIVPLEDLTPEDVWYQPLPTFHLAARFGINLMALANGRVVQREQFSLSAFWPDVREHGCTVANLSPLTRFLNSVPEQPDDADNPLRWVVANPQPPDPEGMCKRFGFTLSASYGTSELGIPISSGQNPVNGQTCGRPRAGWPGVEIRIVDEHDHDVAVGEIGEMVIRTREPWALTSGYFDNPEATAAAWRNGWFHIGDAMRMDEDGNLYFHDRVKDSIRRRGENISSFEVEAEVNTHPAVQESAAVAVKMPGEEDELKVFVVLAEGEQLSPEELCEYLAGRVARFMVPRFVEFIDALPKTEATLRIKKSELRGLGNTDSTWDREAALVAGRAG
jgi:crotonobetaine/carnitine-CoA ligase